MSRTITVTIAARNFAEIINRVYYRGEDFVLERSGQPVAHLVPVPRGERLGALPALLDRVPSLSPEDARELEADLDSARQEMDSARRDMDEGPLRDPWES